MTPRVAIDARKLRDGGIGTYIRELIASLATRAEAPKVTALLGSIHTSTEIFDGPFDDFTSEHRTQRFSKLMYANLPLRVGKISLELCEPIKESISPLRMLVPSVGEVLFRVHRVGYPPAAV